MKLNVLELLTIIICFNGSIISGEDVESFDPISTILTRQKRQGGGGIIPFRPLFVYKQQQKEQQAKWKEIEDRKKLNQQLLQYQQYQAPVKQNQQVYPTRPSTASISHSHPTTQYSSSSYPTSSYYETYNPSYYGTYNPSYYGTYNPSYYGTYNPSYGQYQYDKDPVYQGGTSASNYYQNYYQNYYDGYGGYDGYDYYSSYF